MYKILPLLIFISSFSFSQKSSYSPYSYFGVGDTNFTATVENQMMGGNTIYYDSVHQNMNNAASLSKLKFVNYSVGVGLKNTGYKSGSNREKSTAAGIKYISVAIPTKLISFSFGIKPQTSVGYLLENDDKSQTPAELNRFTGSGGINSAFISLGFELLKNWGFGLSSSYAFGNLNHLNTKILENVELYTTVFSESSVSGLDYNFSTVYKKTFGEKISLYTGFVYQPEANYTSQNKQVISTVNPNGNFGGDFEEIDLLSNGLKETEIKIPKSMSFGLGFGEDKKWFIGLNYKKIDSGGYKNQLMSLNNVEFKSSQTFSVGGFFLPKYDSFTNYFNTITYRAGIRYKSGGLYVNDQQINEIGFCFGFGIPLAGISSANLGFEFGQRGTNESSLIKENFFNIKLGVSLNDLWFVRSMYN
tara:strand:- start:1394 stop:2644 length:1251 start_codon:yes stop_codon:yes gene_type:complete